MIDTSWAVKGASLRLTCPSDVVWPQFLVLSVIGTIFCGVALARFRTTIGMIMIQRFHSGILGSFGRWTL
jgi:hypothetical protein